MLNTQSLLNQLKVATPITQEILDNITDHRKQKGLDPTPRFHSGRTISVGDIVLFCFFEDEIVKENSVTTLNLELVQVHPDEINVLYEITRDLKDEIIFSIKYKTHE